MYRNNYDKSISLVVDKNKADFKLRDLKVQVGQFSALLNSKDVYVGKITEFLNDFEKIIAKSF